MAHTAHIIKLILTDEKVGKGTEEDPVRRKIQLFTKEGTLVAEDDPLLPMRGLPGPRNTWFDGSRL